MTFKDKIKPQLTQNFEIIEVYDDGTAGANEVARVRLSSGQEVVTKVMLGNKKYHQRRKALTEVVMHLLDKGFGGERIVGDLYAELFELTPAYAEVWRPKNIEGHIRICQIVRSYVPHGPGDEWRGEVYQRLGNLQMADVHCRSIIEHHPDAERMSILDFITINQDRSARNWVTDHGNRFFAIDNGMAWFHEYPESDDWKFGCAIDDVILQLNPWQFISGVFTTSWAGRPLSPVIQTALSNFDVAGFLQSIDEAAQFLGFPAGLSEDWRFEGILRRLHWMAEMKRQPTVEEYRNWYSGSKLFTPPEIIASGGKIAWTLEMDFDLA